MNPAIVVDDLTRTYGELVAVDGVSFEVSPGEIVGLIGPNGAGKTTLLECLEGLRTPSGGSVRVLDVDPAHPTPAWRTRIGVQLQTAALPPKIKVREAMSLFASLYDHPADTDELLEELGIAAKRDAYVEKLSGGQRQRVFIALALINRPELVFLDELTTALDPQARLAMWDVVRSIREGGATVLMTASSPWTPCRTWSPPWAAAPRSGCARPAPCPTRCWTAWKASPTCRSATAECGCARRARVSRSGSSTRSRGRAPP